MRYPDHHDPLLAFLGGRFQVGTSYFLFVLALLEVNDGNAVSFGKPIERLHILIADPTKRSRRRNRELSLPAQEGAHLSYGLKPGYVTWVFDRPQAGRMWFEGVIRDHLDVGRPDQIALIFHRRVNGRTPGRFRTRVINPGFDPILCCYYKSSRIKQYFKEGRALRTETVICDRGDFGVGRRVCTQNWNALRAVGESANRRLCDAEAADAQPAPDVATFCWVTRPSTNDDGLYAAALRFGEQRVMAILSALVGFCYLIGGFTNRQLVERVGALLQSPYTCRQATYDLRRLKRKELIAKVAHTNRYQLTNLGRRVAVLFTKTYGRILAPGLSALDPYLPEQVTVGSSLSTAWRCFEKALDDFMQAELVAARKLIVCKLFCRQVELVPVAAVPVEWAVEPGKTGKHFAAVICILVLFCMCIGAFYGTLRRPAINVLLDDRSCSRPLSIA